MSTPGTNPGASAAASGEADIHPVVRNALRLSLNTKEYRYLHDVAVKRAPGLKDKLPSPSRYEALAHRKNRHNEAALRTSLRVLVGSGLALKLVEVVMNRVRPDPEKYAPIIHHQDFDAVRSILIFRCTLQEESSHPDPPLPNPPTLGIVIPPASPAPSALSVPCSTPSKPPHS